MRALFDTQVRGKKLACRTWIGVVSKTCCRADYKVEWHPQPFDKIRRFIM